jgi:hypothetical protein
MAKGNGFILMSGPLPGITSASSKVVIAKKGVDLRPGSLVYVSFALCERGALPTAPTPHLQSPPLNNGIPHCRSVFLQKLRLGIAHYLFKDHRPLYLPVL